MTSNRNNNNNADTALGPINSNNQNQTGLNQNFQGFHPLLATVERAKEIVAENLMRDELRKKVTKLDEELDEEEKRYADYENSLVSKTVRELEAKKQKLEQSGKPFDKADAEKLEQYKGFREKYLRETPTLIEQLKADVTAAKEAEAAFYEAKALSPSPEPTERIFADHLPILGSIPLAKKNDVKIMSYNIMAPVAVYSGFGVISTSYDQEVREPAIKQAFHDIIQKQNPGIINIQEGWFELDKPDVNWPPKGWTCAKAGSGLYMLYDATRYEELPLISKAKEDLVEAGRYNETNVQKVFLKDRNTGKKMLVINPHMAHQDNPEAAQAFLTQLIESNQKLYGCTVIIAGDFNNRFVQVDKPYLVNNAVPPGFNKGKQAGDWTDGIFYKTVEGPIHQAKFDTVDPNTGKVVDTAAIKVDHLAKNEFLTRFKPFMNIATEHSLEKDFPDGLLQKMEQADIRGYRYADAFNQQKIMFTLTKEMINEKGKKVVNPLSAFLQEKYGAGKAFGELIDIPKYEMKLLCGIYFSLDKKEQEKFSDIYKKQIQPLLFLYNIEKREVPIHEFKMLMQIYNSLGKGDKENFGEYYSDHLEKTCTLLRSYRRSLDTLPTDTLASQNREGLVKEIYDQATNLLTSKTFKSSATPEKIEAFNASLQDRNKICSSLISLKEVAAQVEKEIDEEKDKIRKLTFQFSAEQKQDVSNLNNLKALQKSHEMVCQAVGVANDLAYAVLTQPKENVSERSLLAESISNVARLVKNRDEASVKKSSDVLKKEDGLINDSLGSNKERWVNLHVIAHSLTIWIGSQLKQEETLVSRKGPQ